MKLIQYRRKRKGKTDYRKRLNLIISKQPRLVIRKSLRHILVQFVEYAHDGDRIIVSAHTKELRKYGWDEYTCNTPSAYLVGLLAGIKAEQKGITKAILDIGLYPKKGSRIFSALKGVLDAGIEIPHKEGIFPPEERIAGEHIKEGIKARFENTKTSILKIAHKERME